MEQIPATPPLPRLLDEVRRQIRIRHYACSTERANRPASTQDQGKAALLFLYKAVLGIDLPWFREVVSAQGSRRLPVVLTRREVKTLPKALHGTSWLIASLLYGTGMR